MHLDASHFSETLRRYLQPLLQLPMNQQLPEFDEDEGEMYMKPYETPVFQRQNPCQSL
jgi:hypothetical protein